MPRILFIFIFSLLTFVGNNIPAQTTQEKYQLENIETHHFDDKKYEELTKDVDFTEEERQPKKKKNGKNIDPQVFNSIGGFLKFFFIALGIGILVFLLVKALTNESLFLPRDKKLKPVTQIDLEKIEDNLEDAELNDPIRQAIAAGDYTMAVRLYYLAVLKDLSLSKKIKWKKDKTNGEYLRELAGAPIFKSMQEVTLIFERVWYGKIEINKDDFLEIEQLFLKIISNKTILSGK